MFPLELLICIALIASSATLSASELALFSLSRFQLRGLKEHFRSSHRRIQRLLGDPGGLLVTILVLNEIVNVWLSAIITQGISRTPKTFPPFLSHIPLWALDTLLTAIVTTPVILFLCEITPKVIGAKINRLFAVTMAGPLEWIYDLMMPVRVILKYTVLFVAKYIAPTDQPKMTDKDPNRILKESDFLLMIEEGTKDGAIEKSEFELIRNVFELDDTRVNEIFTPMTKVISIPETMRVQESFTSMKGHEYSRIPVTGKNKKEIAGILYAKDLLKSKLHPEQSQLPISNLMRKPIFVSQSLRLNALFRKFKQQKMHMAIVTDSKGLTLGIVTMTDVLDALFEDLLPDEVSEVGARSKPRKGSV